MFTTRFVVKNGYAKAFGAPAINKLSPHIPHIPNGTYEFLTEQLIKLVGAALLELYQRSSHLSIHGRLCLFTI
jgi:outer membrane receptor for ferrienterochelin and colicin